MDLKTGDILLFSERPTSCSMACLDFFIKRCTCSRYSHAALVIVDPPWCTSLKGVFVWESSWHGCPDPQDGIVKLGVQLTPFSLYTYRYPGSVDIWVRRAAANYATPEQWSRVHRQVYRHGYDTRPRDWIAAALRRRITRQTDTFTCSAFVSFVLTQLDQLSTDTCWTTVSAAELSSTRKSSLVQFTGEFDDDEHLGTYTQDALIDERPLLVGTNSPQI